MTLFHAPDFVPPSYFKRSLFLAGGIGALTPVSDWQSELVARLRDTDWTLLNPRRDDYPADNPHALREQIEWEHRHLQAAGAVSFWFPPETLCPITLYELGAWANWRGADGRQKPLVVGAHPDYAKRADLKIQLELTRPDIQLAASLEELEARIRTSFLFENRIR